MSVEYTTTNSTVRGVWSEDSISVAYGWATLVGEALGFTDFEEEIILGSESLETFKGRVLLALAVAPEDEGLPIHTTETVLGSARTHRPAGYLQAKLRALLSVVESGERQGHDTVCWS